MEQIDEKFSWSRFLLILGVSAVFISNYRKFNKIKSIYTQVNSKNSKEESDKIDKIRDSILTEIENSKIFKESDKKFILDSIRVATIKIVDNLDFVENAQGVYMNLNPFKKDKMSLLMTVPSVDNVILIKRNVVNNTDLSTTITHEVYHYFDMLMGKSGSYYSSDIKIDTFIDKRINDKDYCLKKIDKLLLDPYSVYSVKMDNLPPDRKFGKSIRSKNKRLSREEYQRSGSFVDNSVYDILIDDIEYFKSNTEIFTRYKTMKSEMLKRGFISDMNHPLSEEEVIRYIDSLENREKIISLELFLVLDLSKLPELDKLVD